MKKSIVVKAAAAFVAVLVILPSIALGLWLFQKLLLGPEENRARPPGAYASAAQEAEFESGLLRKGIQREEKARLNSYGWVEKEKGLVHIPIDRAMELMLERQKASRNSKENTP